MTIARRLIGYNLLSGIVLGVVGWYVGWYGAHAVVGPSLDYFGDIDYNELSVFLGLPRRRDRLPDRPRLPPLPAPAPARLSAVAAREGDGGHRPLLQPLHRPQGRRHPVPVGRRALLLHRRPARDADPLPAAEPEQGGVLRRLVSHHRRDPRHDDDGDHDERDPRPVRQLPRAAHDRLAADGVPADRVAHVLAADVGRHDPPDDGLLRRLPDRLDGLRAALEPVEPRDGLLHPLLRARRHLDHAARPQHVRDDRDDARAGPDVDAAADLRLGRPLDRDADGARGAGADRGALDGGARPHRADDLLRHRRRRE